MLWGKIGRFLFRTDRAILSGRALHSKDRRDYPHLGVLPDDLYIQFEPWPRIGRPPKHDVAAWTVADHWPRRVPVTEAEVDVFEAGLRPADWAPGFGIPDPSRQCPETAARAVPSG